MVALFKNNAFSTLASGIGTSDTSITVDTGDGALFPSPTGTDYFYATLIDTAGNLEIVKCTSRSTDTLTVTRAQEGTTATAYSTGDRIELRVTAAGLTDVISQCTTAQAAAEAALDSFDDRYLGAKSSAPAVDNDGDALIDGALYFNTTDDEMYVYDLGNTTWITVSNTATSVAAAASAANAATSESNAAASAAAAAAVVGGLWTSVVTLTTGTTNIEIADGRTYYLCDTSGGDITINLPAIGINEGITYGLQKVGASNSVNVVRDGTDTINGGTSYTLSADTEVVTLVANDTSPDDWIATVLSQTVAGTGLQKSGSTMSIASKGVATSHVAGSVNAQTGISYTGVLTDAFKTVTMDNASANTFTIPAYASVAYAVGDRIDIVMKGAGVTTITADTGVTLNGVSAGSGDIQAPYTAVSLLNVAEDVWLMIGNHSAVA